MMRFAWVIVFLAGIAAAVVHLRLQQTQMRSQVYRLEAERLKVRRDLWAQQLRLGELTAPQNIRRLTAGWPVEMVGPGDSPPPARRVVHEAP